MTLVNIEYKKLLKEAEWFICKNDIHAEIIIDGKIKNGAKLLVDFYLEMIKNKNDLSLLNRVRR